MVDSRRLDEILVQAGLTPAPAKETGMPVLAGRVPKIPAQAPAAAKESRTR
jgi:hypothetical protein